VLGARAALPRLERTLAGFCAVFADAPWTITAADLQSLRAVGLGDEAVLHVVVLAAYFNDLNRVADAVDIAFDYESPLPRLEKNAQRVPLPRPARSAWPTGAPPLDLPLSLRPASFAALTGMARYLLERDAPLRRRERMLVVRTVSEQLGDARGFAPVEALGVTSAREQALVDYAVTLTVAPWQLSAAHVDRLRGHGLDDAAVLDLICVAAFQNTASRLDLVLGPGRGL
jgi:alkylhydroperoxidase family enzyme